jgi:hypothetical protein
MKPVRPWPATAECPLPGYQEFANELSIASYHNAAERPSEAPDARSATRAAAEIAIEHEWPVWAMQRMFKEIAPLVMWEEFLQAYINILFEMKK